MSNSMTVDASQKGTSISDAEKTESQKVKSPLLKKNKFSLPAWFKRNYVYFIAFFLPIALTYVAYAIFGMMPWGEKSPLVLDLNGQYVYYYEAMRDAIWGDGSIFYSWSRNLSGEFMGTIAYYIASPFMWILFLLPQSMILVSLLIVILCKIGAAGVTFCYYIRKRKGFTGWIDSVTFSTMYAMMAYVIIQTIDPMWLDGAVWLPMIIIGVERCVDEGKKVNLIVPLAIMFVSHFYIGYMIAIFTAAYFLYYTFLGTNQRGRSAKQIGYTILNGIISAILGLMCAAFMLLPIYHALQLGKFDFTQPDFSFKFQFEFVGLFRQLMIDQYDSVNVQGSPEIYCGVLSAVLVPLFFMNKKIQGRRRIGYACMFVFMMICMCIRPIDMAWHGFQSPNWLPYRYSFVVSFLLVSMAAEAFKNLDGIKPSKLIGVLIGYIFAALIVGTVIPKGGCKVDNNLVKFEYEKAPLVSSLIASCAFATGYLILLFFRFGGTLKKISKEKTRKIVSVILSVVTLCGIGGEEIFNAQTEFKKVDKEVTYSTEKSWTNYIANGRKVTRELYKYDDSLYRCDKTFFRCINDNMAFGLRGVSHSTSVMNARILKFLEAMGYATRTYYCRYDGNTSIADSLLGIKYVLNRESDNSKILNKDYTPIWSYNYTDQDDKDQTITCYQNPNALSIGYMVDSDIENITAFGNDNPFNSQNILLSTLVGETDFGSDGTITPQNEYYTPVTLDGDPIYTNIDISDYGDQKCYTATNKEDPGANTIDYHFTVTENSPIYIYFRTDNESPVNLWYGPYKESTGDYDFEFLSTYFETEHYCIMSLGSYEPGTKVCLRMTVANDYVIYRNAYFMYFHKDVYQNSIDKLKENQWDVKAKNGRELSGKITAKDGQIMLTSIPWEPGWTVKVDGKKTEPVKVADALLGVNLTPGEHTVWMKYTPPGFNLGIILLIIGGGITIFLGIFYMKKEKSYYQPLFVKNTKYLQPKPEKKNTVNNNNFNGKKKKSVRKAEEKAKKNNKEK